MSGLLKLKAEAGGSVILAANSAATTDYTLTLPGANTVFVGTDLVQPLSNKTITNSTMAGGALTSGTVANTATGGTSYDFTGIPSWVKRITVMFNGVSLSGTSSFLIQLGAGSIVITGYSGGGTRFGGSSLASASFTTGFGTNNVTPTANYGGAIVLSNVSGSIWSASGVLGVSGGTESSVITGGNVTLTGTLDRVRITTVNGTDTFDAGTVNILYE